MGVVELRLRSAEDLKDVRRVGVGRLLHPHHALAWITPPLPRVQSLHKLRTSPPQHTLAQSQAATLADEDDQEGTLFPTWQHTSNSHINIHVDNTRSLSNSFVVIRLYACHGRSAMPSRRKDRLVGTVTIPLPDIMSGNGQSGGNHWQILSYNVKRPSGRLHGILNLSARFSEASIH